MYRSPDPDELADDVDAAELESIDTRIRLGLFPGGDRRRGQARRDPDRRPDPCPCHGVRVAAPTPLELVDGR